MPAAPLPANEADRLSALRRSGALESGPDPRLDDIVQRVFGMAGASVAAISLVDETRQVFKSSIGLGVPHTARDVSFCAYVILSADPLVVLDAKQDARFVDNALVCSPPFVSFYLGVPVFGPGHHPFGALFVLDSAPRQQVSPELLALLRKLAAETSEILAAEH
ncbi:MAG: GAF domain-containing protein [Rhodospirillales bacterium]